MQICLEMIRISASLSDSCQQYRWKTTSSKSVLTTNGKTSTSEQERTESFTINLLLGIFSPVGQLWWICAQQCSLQNQFLFIYRAECRWASQAKEKAKLAAAANSDQLFFQQHMKIDDCFKTVLLKDFYLPESFCNIKTYIRNFHWTIWKFCVIWINRLCILPSQTSCLPMACVGGTLNVVSDVNRRIQADFPFEKPHVFMNLDIRQCSFQNFNDFSRN